MTNLRRNISKTCNLHNYKWGLKLGLLSDYLSKKIKLLYMYGPNTNATRK